MHSIHLQHPDHPNATLEGYLLDCEITLGQEKNRPAILICPGGGYVYCSPREAEPVALRDAAGFAPLEEVSHAIGLLRERAEEWHIDPQKIAVCGFSAGGHLALASGLLAEHKPNAMILGYPAAQLPNYPGADFMLKLLTGRETVTDEDAEAFSLIGKITKDAPPVFLAATAEDFLTAYGALPIAKAYSDLGRPYELHIFQYGPHGYSLADVTTADGSSQVLDEAFAQWHSLSVLWLRKTFGQPQFTDKSTSKMAAYLQELGISMPGMSGSFA